MNAKRAPKSSGFLHGQPEDSNCKSWNRQKADSQTPRQVGPPGCFSARSALLERPVDLQKNVGLSLEIGRLKMLGSPFKLQLDPLKWLGFPVGFLFVASAATGHLVVSPRFSCFSVVPAFTAPQENQFMHLKLVLALFIVLSTRVHCAA